MHQTGEFGSRFGQGVFSVQKGVLLRQRNIRQRGLARLLALSFCVFAGASSSSQQTPPAAQNQGIPDAPSAVRPPQPEPPTPIPAATPDHPRTDNPPESEPPPNQNPGQSGDQNSPEAPL